MSRRPTLDHLVAVPARALAPPPTAVAGTDLSGEPYRLEVGGSGPAALLLFLSSSCDGCLPLWQAAAQRTPLGLGEGDQVVVVVHDPGREDTRAVRSLASAVSPSPPVVMSSAAWRAYRVHGGPFFVLVSGEKVVTEGVAWSVEQVAADVRRALGGV